jgi:hypothetical protein
MEDDEDETAGVVGLIGLSVGGIVGLSVGGALVLCCAVGAVTFFVYALSPADGNQRCRARTSQLGAIDCCNTSFI